MILVSGSNGQLGQCLAKCMDKGNTVFADKQTLDITDRNAVLNFVRDNNIDTIINCAAYTAVDKAESEPELARKINVDGPLNLASTGAKIIHVSTDYVFDGKNNVPYTPKDKTNPVSVYGKTKRNGEIAVEASAKIYAIIRTQWLYSEFGKNFAKTMQTLGATKDTLNVVADQVGTPTYAGDLAMAITKIIPQLKPENSGIYHFSNEGVCSWYDFTKMIAEYAGNTECIIQPCHSDEFPSPVKRPAYSVLDKTKVKETFGISIPYWTESLKVCIKNLRKE